MNEKVMTFRDLVEKIHEAPWTSWVYLPNYEKWSLDSISMVLESEEVSPEQEDEPNAGVPEVAKKNHLKYALSVHDLQGVISNARAQKENVTIEELFEAFEYYYKNDAFINLA